MTYLSPYEKRRRRSTHLRTFAIIIVGFVIFTLLDFPLRNLFYFNPSKGIEHHDWYRMLRVVGFLGTWVVIALVFILNDRNRHRGLAILFSAALSGAIAELAKLLIARERPVENGIIQSGLYHFRGFFSGFADGSNLGLPSSHAAVAFGGCFMLAAIVPSARRLLILLALGCGLTRMLTGAHFSTDIYLGAIIGWLVSLWFVHLTPTLEPRYRTLR